jgi:hypothetical protein
VATINPSHSNIIDDTLYEMSKRMTKAEVDLAMAAAAQLLRRDVQRPTATRTREMEPPSVGEYRMTKAKGMAQKIGEGSRDAIAVRGTRTFARSSNQHRAMTASNVQLLSVGNKMVKIKIGDQVISMSRDDAAAVASLLATALG